MATNNYSSGSDSDSNGSTSSHDTPETFFRLGEIREPRDEDFQHFLNLAHNHEGWTPKHDKNGVRVWMRDIRGQTVKMLKVWANFSTVSCSVLYDMLQDSAYRFTWDEALLREQTVCLLEGTNSEIGYYSMKCPKPLKNRDFVYQRCWRVKENKEYITFNHSVAHESFPPTKHFIRAISRVTGFLLIDAPQGCQACYVTHSDPRGKVPKWLLNIVACKITPRVFLKIARAAELYSDWKRKHNPGHKPWLYQEQSNVPIVSINSLTQYTEDSLPLTPTLSGSGGAIPDDFSDEEDELEDTDTVPDGLAIDPVLLTSNTDNDVTVMS